MLIYCLVMAARSRYILAESPQVLTGFLLILGHGLNKIDLDILLLSLDCYYLSVDQ